MRIEHLYRYPVKGLTAEALESTLLAAGETIAWDRAFALAQGDAPFDPDAPEWTSKTHFMCLMANARAAALKSAFEARSGRLTIRAPGGDSITENAMSAPGRAAIAAWLAAYLGEEARGTPRFHHVAGYSFSDVPEKVVTLINLASIADLAAKVGAPRDKMRFRANLYFSGADAWSEFDWLDREVLAGGARLRITGRVARCPATEVNPDTAQRDAKPMRELRQHFGHPDLGVYAEVIEGGEVAVGDALELLTA